MNDHSRFSNACKWEKGNDAPDLELIFEDLTIFFCVISVVTIFTHVCPRGYVIIVIIIVRVTARARRNRRSYNKVEKLTNATPIRYIILLFFVVVFESMRCTFKAETTLQPDIFFVCDVENILFLTQIM